MRLTDSQYGALYALAERGPQTAEEVAGPRGMDGKRRATLKWGGAPSTQLAALESAGLVRVERGETLRPVNAVGKPGNPRRKLTISITDAGRGRIKHQGAAK